MDESFETSVLTSDPFSAMVHLGVFFGLLAGLAWYRVFRSAVVGSDGSKLPTARSLQEAALVTALALILGCGGFLLGRLTGQY